MEAETRDLILQTLNQVATVLRSYAAAKRVPAPSVPAMSDQIDKLAEALAHAQAEIKPAEKNKENPHFKSSYADLASVWDSIREPLAKNGLCAIQTSRITESGNTILVTMLAHSSGQWIRSELPLVLDKQTAQGQGSAISYARRYSLSAITGAAPVDDDDDGNAASGNGQPNGKGKAQAQAPKQQSNKQDSKASAESKPLSTSQTTSAPQSGSPDDAATEADVKAAVAACTPFGWTQGSITAKAKTNLTKLSKGALIDLAEWCKANPKQPQS